MPKEENPNTKILQEIEQNTEHALLATQKNTEAVQELEPIMEGVLTKVAEVAENTKPKDVVKVQIDGISVITIKGDKGDKWKFEELTDEQKEELRGFKGDPLKFEDLTDEQKAEIKGEDGHTPTEEELTSIIKPLIPVVKDGKTPTKKELTALIKPLVPTVEEICQGMEDMMPETDDVTEDRVKQLIEEAKPIEKDDIEKGVDIVRILQALPLEKRLDYDKLFNLPNLSSFRRPTGIASKDYATSELTDVDMTGIVAGQALVWNGTKFLPGSSGGATAFTDLTDVPNSYAGQSLKVVRVNAGETGLEFATISGGSGITRAVVNTSGSITMGATASVDYVYFVTGAHTLTCPTAIGNTNRYTVKNNHSANITVDTSLSQTIDGALSITIIPGDSRDLVSDGSNWYII